MSTDLEPVESLGLYHSIISWLRSVVKWFTNNQDCMWIMLFIIVLIAMCIFSLIASGGAIQ